MPMVGGSNLAGDIPDTHLQKCVPGSWGWGRKDGQVWCWLYLVCQDVKEMAWPLSYLFLCQASFIYKDIFIYEDASVSINFLSSFFQTSRPISRVIPWFLIHFLYFRVILVFMDYLIFRIMEFLFNESTHLLYYNTSNNHFGSILYFYCISS